MRPTNSYMAKTVSWSVRVVVFLIPVCLAASNCTNSSSRIKNSSVLLNPVAIVYSCCKLIGTVFPKNKQKKQSAGISVSCTFHSCQQQSWVHSTEHSKLPVSHLWHQSVPAMPRLCGGGEAAWPSPCTIYTWRSPSCVVQYSMRIDWLIGLVCTTLKPFSNHQCLLESIACTND